MVTDDSYTCSEYNITCGVVESRCCIHETHVTYVSTILQLFKMGEIVTSAQPTQTLHCLL